jgi:glutamate/tyrosine decarboxylase-like PLP-dependent enzyme
MVAEMLGYGGRSAWAHICSGGTIANLEALWVARMAQCMPFMLRGYCKTNAAEFAIKTANGQQARLIDLSDRELIGLRPNQAIDMTRQLARYEVDALGRELPRVLGHINQAIRESDYNVKLRGFDRVVGLVKMRPVIFVSAAAHYCIKKVANVLGYGEDSVRLVPVSPRFRADVSAMRAAIERLGEDEYVAAVVGVAGTTEEGAVDPLHELVLMRDALSKTRNQSFWLHVDAAWGGYIRSIFCGHEGLSEHEKLLGITSSNFDEVCAAFVKAIGAQDSADPAIKWDDPDVFKAFLAMPAADSIAIDPHKMGYVPYPAGIVAFKNGLVTELMTQRAQYISDESEGVQAIERMAEVKAVGPYILEGSKPGAAATACWLQHATIPLNVHGHGKMVRVSLLNAKRLHRYLQMHRTQFASYDESGSARTKAPFTFVPLFEPDTNIVCFVCMPMQWRGDGLIVKPTPLPVINDLNKRIHAELDIPKARRGMQTPYAKEYFVSNTKFERSQYSSQSLSILLAQLGITAEDYDAHGLIVLRSTVMNPLYDTARAEGTDYLAGFVRHLHGVARFVNKESVSQWGSVH